MRELLPFVISGIATGAVYGLAGSGLVLTYKTSGVFNFGHGALATVAAYFFYFLHYDHGLHWVPSLLISVLVLGALMGLVMERIATKLVRQRTAMQVVGTIGIALMVQGLATIKYGPEALDEPRKNSWIPFARSKFRLLDVNITVDKVVVAVVATLAVVGLWVLFRFTRLGVAMRGVVDDPDLVAMLGTNPMRVRRVAWIIGAVFAALSGVIVAPLLGIESIVLTFLVVKAFGAAAIGGFSSIPLTFAGGILMGIMSDVSKKFVLDVRWLSGLPEALPFAILFVVLLLLPKRKLVRPNQVEARAPLQYRSPPRVRLTTGVVVLVPLLLIPGMVGHNLIYFMVGLSSAVMLLSLGLLVRVSGQVSLCHAAFAAIGAVAFAQLNTDGDVPWLLALVLAGLIVVPVGALIAIPAIRLSGLFLALATLGFGILVQRLVYNEDWMFTHFAEGRRMNRPSFAEGDHAWYYFVLAVLVFTSIVITVIQRSRLGRMLQGMSEAPVAVSALGLSTNVSRVIVFCISAFFAAISGVLYSTTFGFAISSDRFFSPFNSLILLAMLSLAPFAEPWYALVPAVANVLPAYIDSDHTTDWLNVVFGLSAILIAMEGSHPPMPARLRGLLDRFAKKPRPEPVETRGRSDGARAPATREGSGLEVSGLTIRFGGIVAIDDLSLKAPLGRITGLIGPNGAGKTSTFDACSGLNRRFGGRITLNGVDITTHAPPARGRAGLGRTFQRMQLGDALTVRQNVAMGDEAARAGKNVIRQIAATRSEWRRTNRDAEEAMALCGVAHLADLQVGALSTGERRLVELARCVAGRFDLLLLDEPSSGLDVAETERFGALLQSIVAERGIGVVLVEHDMSLVMSISTHIYVLDFGRLIFEGDPDEVSHSEIVHDAYLGTKRTDPEKVTA